MAIISKKVLPIAKILSQELVIPNYQRPYKWRAKHVNQLLDDIISYQAKSCYRLGTIVLYKGKDAQSYSIVDGQQRLLTLTLLCTVLDETNKKFRARLLAHNFESKISITNLQNNANVIESRLPQFTKEGANKSQLWQNSCINHYEECKCHCS